MTLVAGICRSSMKQLATASESGSFELISTATFCGPPPAVAWGIDEDNAATAARKKVANRNRMVVLRLNQAG